MPGQIKGITIQFNGDTTKLDKALKEIKSDSKSVDAQLKQVNRALKFNPNNVELMRQKFQLLGQKVDQTENEIKQLRNVERQLSAAGVSKQSAEWMKVRREIIQAESKLKHFKAQLKTVKAPNMKAIGNGFKTAGQNMRMAGTYATIGGAVMIGAGKKLLEANSTQEQSENKLIEIYKKRMGANEEAAKSTMELASAIQQEGVIGDEVTLSGAQQLATFAKMPGTVDKLLPAMDNLLVQQKGYNATAEDATSVANLMGKAMNGNVGALKKVGISFTDAQAEILKYGTEEEKAAVLSEVITDNVGDMNKVFAETDEGKMQQVKNSLGDFAERLGATLLPVLGQAAGWLNDKLLPVIDKVVKFIEDHPIIAKIAVGVTALLAVLGPLLIILGGMASGVGALISVFSVLAGPVGIVIGIMAALAAIAVLVYKNWDKIKAFAATTWEAIRTAVVNAATKIKTTVVTIFTAVRDKIVSIFSGLKNIITAPFRGAVGIIRAAINKIKNIVNKAKLKLPKFKLPHFKIKGGKLPWGIGGKGTAPSISVKWYKNGGIFDKPTLAGLGEAGKEAIVPLSGKQMEPFAAAIAANLQNVGGIDYERLAACIVGAMSAVQQTVNVNIDGKTAASTMAPYMEPALNTLSARRNRQLGYV